MRLPVRFVSAVRARDLKTPIILSAVMLRLVFCFLFIGVVESFDVPPLEGETRERAGADGYIQIARTWYESGEYSFESGTGPAHGRPPVQPFLMLIFGAWSTHQWLYVWFAGSALINLGYLVVLHRLGALMRLPVAWNNLLLLSAGFHPYLVFISKSTTFINAATLVLAASVLLFFAIPRNFRVFSLLCGLVCGVGALTHGSFMILPAVLIAAVLARREMKLRRRFASAILIALACAAAVLPWTIRNYRHFHRIIPSATGAGLQYWIGDAAYFRTEFKGDSLFRERTGRDLRVMPYSRTMNAEDDAVLVGLAKEHMRRDPVHLAERLAIGYLAFWAPWDTGRMKALVSGILNYPLVLAALFLFCAGAIRKKLAFDHVALGAVIFSFVSVFAFFTAYGSYFAMLLPLLLLLMAKLAIARSSIGAGRPATIPESRGSRPRSRSI
jgi:4-amino-4-deoxy-L-arabinose transferase-like glycosyltransferase